jgi:hypothetical protein
VEPFREAAHLSGFATAAFARPKVLGRCLYCSASCHPIVALRPWAGERDQAGEAEERINKARTDSATDYR